MVAALPGTLTLEMVLAEPRSTLIYWVPVLLLLQKVLVQPSTALAAAWLLERDEAVAVLFRARFTSLTVTISVSVAVAPSLSVTVSVTVLEPAVA